MVERLTTRGQRDEMSVRLVQLAARCEIGASLSDARTGYRVRRCCGVSSLQTNLRCLTSQFYNSARAWHFPRGSLALFFPWMLYSTMVGIVGAHDRPWSRRSPWPSRRLTG